MRAPVLLAALLLACRPTPPTGPAAPTGPCSGTIDDLAWLAGAWQRGSPGATSEEHWTAPAGGTMLGLGRSVAGGRTEFFEFMRIEARPGGLVLIAHPAAGPGVEFPSTHCATGEVRFEDPAHDMPQTIGYRLAPDGSLAVHVGGRDPAGTRHDEHLVLHRVEAAR